MRGPLVLLLPAQYAPQQPETQAALTSAVKHAAGPKPASHRCHTSRLRKPLVEAEEARDCAGPNNMLAGLMGWSSGPSGPGSFRILTSGRAIATCATVSRTHRVRRGLSLQSALFCTLLQHTKANQLSDVRSLLRVYKGAHPWARCCCHPGV